MFDRLTDALDQGVVILDPELRVEAWNRWMTHRTGISADEAIGEEFFALVDAHEEDRLRKYCRMVLAVGTYAFMSQKLHGYCIPIATSDVYCGEFEFMQQNCTIGPVHGDDDTITSLFLTVQDVTELAVFERRLAEYASRDALTGVQNRRSFDAMIDAEFSRRQSTGGDLSVIMFDLDHFKTVNDLHGHEVGDDVLRSVARAVRLRLRNADTLSRYGGEEFCIVLTETNHQQAEVVAEQLRRLVEQLDIPHREGSIRVTASFGVASASGSSESVRGLIRRADAAMYAAKRNGRNRVESSLPESRACEPDCSGE